MKRVAIITVAGISSRFNTGMAEDEKVLKCLYTEGNAKDTLLYHMLMKLSYADRIIIVGGYKYDALKQYIEESLSALVLPELKEKIRLVYNDHYEDLSSGYSLYMGLKAAFEEGDISDVMFAEGDLDVDGESLETVINTDATVLTYNHEPIKADKAVVLYVDGENRYHYAFNSSHGLLSIRDSFSAIYNSGQIWKFTDIEVLKLANEVFIEKHRVDTNLAIIQEYLNHTTADRVKVFPFVCWTNCNPRDDYRYIKERWDHEESERTVIGC